MGGVGRVARVLRELMESRVAPRDRTIREEKCLYSCRVSAQIGGLLRAT